MSNIEERRKKLNERIINYNNSTNKDEKEWEAIQEEFTDIYSEDLLERISVKEEDGIMGAIKW